GRKALKVVEAELTRQVVFGDGVLTYRQEARLYLDADAVLASMRVGLRERPDLWQTWSATVSQLAEMGRLDEALGLAREATARFPLLPKVWLDLAYVQRMRLDVAGERDALEQGLKADPALEDTTFKLAALHERNGEFDKSLALLETACTYAPLHAGVHGGAADMLWKLGRRD